MRRDWMAVTSVDECKRQRVTTQALTLATRRYYGMAQVEAAGGKVKKELDHIRVHKGTKGGHIVEHHHTHFAHPPERHVFGKHEGGKLLAHLGKHLGIPASEEEAGEEQHDAME